MSDRINLKEIERRAYLSYHEDGLIDILIGIGILTAGMWLYAEMLWLVGSVIAIFTPVYMSMKRKITFPRIGQVEFSKKRTGRLMKISYFFIAINLVGLLAGYVFFTAFSGDTRPTWIYTMIDNYAIIIGLFGAFILAIIAWITELTRYYTYAVLTLVLIGSANFIPTSFIIHLVALGAVITVAGYLQLQKFKQKYPID